MVRPKCAKRFEFPAEADPGFCKGGGTSETFLCDHQFCCIISGSDVINIASTDHKCGKMNSVSGVKKYTNIHWHGINLIL